MIRTILLPLALIACFEGKPQQNFSYKPVHPKPGDVITILYTPAGELVKTGKTVEGIYLLYGQNKFRAFDLKLEPSGNSYIGTVNTDTSVNLVQFGFYADETFDNNFNKGYQVQLWAGDKVVKGSFNSLALVYSIYGDRTGLEEDNVKALAMLEKEWELYPDNKKATEWTYFDLLGKIKKDTLLEVIEKEVEEAMTNGLSMENDYSRVEYLYNLANLKAQSAFIGNLKRNKFPDGNWKRQEEAMKAYSETDPAKKMLIAKELLSRICQDTAWKKFSYMKNYLTEAVMEGYIAANQLDSLKKYESDTTVYDKLAELYNNIAWSMQEENRQLKKAEQLSAWATAFAKKELTSPGQNKPDYLTGKRWHEIKKYTYAMYADTYGMIEYKLGNYAEGFPYAEEAAIAINKGKDINQNNTYSLLAEKVLRPAECMDKLSQFVMKLKASDSCKVVLKRVYSAVKGSDTGFPEFIAGLETEAIAALEAEIKKSKLNLPAPLFRIKTLHGEEVDLEKMKGKVVILDFWATWCGPCTASLPYMQMEVNKHKNNPDVQFFFVDSWEQGEAEEKITQAKKFMERNKYDFTILMDNDNSVIGMYKIKAVPTKLIIGKDGMIKFKSEGFSDPVTLQQEMELMIRICLNQ